MHSPALQNTRPKRFQCVPFGVMSRAPTMATGCTGAFAICAMSANPPCMVTGWSSLLMRVPSGNTSTHSPRCSAACARRTAFRSAVPRFTGMAPARENSHDTKLVLLNSLFEIGLTRIPWK